LTTSSDAGARLWDTRIIQAPRVCWKLHWARLAAAALWNGGNFGLCRRVLCSS